MTKAERDIHDFLDLHEFKYCMHPGMEYTKVCACGAVKCGELVPFGNALITRESERDEVLAALGQEIFDRVCDRYDWTFSRPEFNGRFK